MPPHVANAYPFDVDADAYLSAIERDVLYHMNKLWTGLGRIGQIANDSAGNTLGVKREDREAAPSANG